MATELAAPVEPWWRQAHEAAGRLASIIDAAVSRASRDGVYEPPPGAPAPRRRRRPGSLRHLAEVIRTHRLAPGLAVDKDIVARVLDGDLRYVTDPVAVVAIARASCVIAGTPFDEDDARRLTVACAYVATLVEHARDADVRAPGLVPSIRTSRALQPFRRPGKPRRTRRLILAAAAVVALTVALLVARSGGGSPQHDAATVAAVQNPDCYAAAPPAGTDLLDVPHRHPDVATAAKMNDWWPNDGRIEMGAYGVHDFEATVRTGSVNVWDLVIVRSCLPLLAGRAYRLTLTAQASTPMTVRVRVQEPYGVVQSFSTDLRAGPRPQRLDMPFVARGSTRQGELMFQVGGDPADSDLRVTGIALTS